MFLDSQTESAPFAPQFIRPQVVSAGGPPQRLYRRRIIRGGRGDWNGGVLRAREFTQQEQQR